MKKTAKKSSTNSKSNKVENFEPGKVSLAVASLAAISLLWLALVGITS